MNNRSELAKQGLPPEVRTQIEARSSNEQERGVDAQAYRNFIALIAATKDKFVKRVIEQTLEFAIAQADMRLSYIFEIALPQAIEDQKKARRALQPFALHAGIERVISKSIDTAVGQSLRYPLYTSAYCSRNKRVPRNVSVSEDNMLPENFRGAYYELGSHRLKVGTVAEEIVKMIEDRYGLDFEKLEQQRQNAHTS